MRVPDPALLSLFELSMELARHLDSTPEEGGHSWSRLINAGYLGSIELIFRGDMPVGAIYTICTCV